MALYQAKHGGRNRYSLFEWSMKERLHRVREIEAGLRRAIARGEFSMRYQPIFDMETCQIACCEALIRWRHPVLGDLSPGEFRSEEHTSELQSLMRISSAVFRLQHQQTI